MIKRRRVEKYRLLIPGIKATQHLIARRNPALDPLGPSGSARRIDHRRAFQGCIDFGVRHWPGLRCKARRTAAIAQPDRDTRTGGANCGQHIPSRLARQNCAGAAILDNVTHLIGCQMPVHRSEIEARPLRCPCRDQKVSTIFHQDRDMILCLDPAGGKLSRQCIGARIELCIG